MMKAVSWLASVTVGVAALTSSAFATTPQGWSTNLSKALTQAKREKKSVLVEFTGSDWCPPCMLMRKTVFSQKDFVDKASEKFVLVELDFPKGDPTVAELNQPLAEKYAIDGFPTVLLLDPNGKEFSRFYASEYPLTNLFLAHIDKQLANRKLD